MTGHGRVNVSFIVPVRNDAGRLKTCLAAIALSHDSRTAIEVIVADNGSTDDSRDVAAAEGARVLSLPGLRVAALRNRAAAAAAGDFLAFVDADHEIVPTWVASAVDVLAVERVGAVGALYSAPVAGSWVQRMYGALRGRTSGRHDVVWLGSGNLVVRRNAFEAIGGFDASLEACEDVDLCLRLRAAGWRVVADERLKSVHLGDPATLSTLFRAERWRGRDNLRVSLRGPFSVRQLPSMLIPVVDLTCGAAGLAGLLLWPFIGSRSFSLFVAGSIVVGGLAAIRTVRIVSGVVPRSPSAIVQAYLVAVTYDSARAAALITRSPHHRGASRDRTQSTDSHT
jgi:glycosyltransferase involved in cell wall biosynthesis